MTIRKVSAVLGLLAVAAAIRVGGGCGSGGSGGSSGALSGCESWCSAAQRCPSMPQFDCNSACSADDRIAAAADCVSKFDAAFSCVDGLSDVCSTPSDCVAPVKAWGACLDGYCASNPTSSDCVTIASTRTGLWAGVPEGAASVEERP